MKIKVSFLRVFGTALMVSAFMFQSMGQSACNPGSYAVFSNATGETPVVLNVLGTSPQFGEIPKHTAASAISHLKSVYANNSKNSRAELDNFMRALGYSGLKDPQFSVSKIEPQVLNAGKTGWMGAYSKGHKYKWSTLGKDFPTFKIMSADGSCHAYIMKKCGNAFYDPSERCIPCTPCDPNYNDPSRCPSSPAALAAVPKTTCATQTLNFSGKGKIQAGDVVNSTKSFPLVASNNGKNLCLGDYVVPVRLTYDVTASGEVNYSKTVQVCDYGNGVVANSSINMPLVIKYALAASDVSAGEDGKISLAVNDKQYKALSAAYKACPSNMASGTSNTTLVAKNTDAASQASGAGAAGSGTKCVKQTLNFSGNNAVEEVSNKTGTQEVTIIGKFLKTGKLEKGETADKYLCLGTYTVPTKSALQYNVNANSNLNHILEVCGDDNTKPSEDITVPVSLTKSVSTQDVMVGDYGRITIPLTAAQYKKLGKSFKRCCGDGTTGGKCK